MIAAIEEKDVQELLAKLRRLRSEIGKAIVGQEEVIEQLLLTLLAGGHALLEGVPGLAKTLMVKTLARSVGLSFKRIQFTPDLMPSDILGTEVLEEDVGTGRRIFRFNRGPIFANLVLADEINRASPKTQSALLEVMQEAAVTYGGTTYALERPFLVLATQNPIEQAGTYPLPEAQLDRFLLYLRIAYPSAPDEARIVAATTGGAEPDVSPVLDAAEILTAQSLTRQVHTSTALVEYATRLVRATRAGESDAGNGGLRDLIEWGAGPRAGQAIVLAAKARALLSGRYSTTLDDVRAVVGPALRHRLVLSFRAQAERIGADEVVAKVVAAVPEPKSPLE
jgi:MoxR-like ATPase